MMLSRGAILARSRRAYAVAPRSFPDRLLRAYNTRVSTSIDTGGGAHAATVGGPPSPRIPLTPTESMLFDFLLYIQHLYAPTTQLRVAGGWVRDKLRGAESEDIDIVLDNIYGKEFANHITKFQRSRRLPTSSVGVVKANSEKSKHLEVAQVKIDGHVVDLVHLRSEAYSDDSRIPDAQFAAPSEDAMRRDLTINALFYNLHTQQVEDLTGRGLADLHNKIIRTPLAPYQTFLDDPLRVLRVIRFACEFGFALDDAISETVLNHEEIRDAMVRKVSRERVGIEVRKMLSGSDPARAFALLAQFKLLDIVFHHAGDGGESTAALQELFKWTPAHVARGSAHLAHLQRARKSMDNHQISFVEATGAILAPFVVPPASIDALKLGLETFLPSANSVENDSYWLPHVDEEMLLDTAQQYRQQLHERDDLDMRFPREDVIELLKINVKWPKPAAKRVTVILEAMLAFPRDLESSTVAQNHLKLFLWSMKYRDVLSPAIATLLTELAPPSDRDSLVVALDALAHRFTQRPHSAQGGEAVTDKKRVGRRVDGKQISDRLGGKLGPHIAIALEVLALWEFVHPLASLDEELQFLDRLHQVLQ